MKHPVIEAVKDLIRQPHTWPGGYSKRLVMADGEVLCCACAKAEFPSIVQSTKSHARDGWEAAGVDVHWEGPPDYCAHCNVEMPSEYGDPDDETE